MMDIELKCVEHGGTFIFPQKDQEYYEQNGWGHPKRCKECRQKRKNRMNSPFAKVLDKVKH